MSGSGPNAWSCSASGRRDVACSTPGTRCAITTGPHPVSSTTVSRTSGPPTSSIECAHPLLAAPLDQLVVVDGLADVAGHRVDLVPQVAQVRAPGTGDLGDRAGDVARAEVTAGQVARLTVYPSIGPPA